MARSHQQKTFVKAVILSLILFAAIGCEEEKSNEPGSTIILPGSYTIAPDTIPNEKDSVMIEFDHASSKNCKKYDGVKIVSQSGEEINLQFVLENQTMDPCPDAINYVHDSLKISMLDRDALTINFLNSDNEKVISRKIVKGDVSDSSFLFEYKGVPLDTYENLRDTMKVIFHNHKNRELSSYRDSLLIYSFTDFKTRLDNVPTQYENLYYTLLVFDKNCSDDIIQECPYRLPYFFHTNSRSYKFKRGIPEVIKIHDTLFEDLNLTRNLL
mgnify:CR=1 FL=1